MAKLRGRITQRLAGTRGVLLSMSGYSDEALEGIVRGQQLDVLLLDRTHLEAMLSGLLSPSRASIPVCPPARAVPMGRAAGGRAGA
jgi:hypothetical protein